jgi:hypothetical protein
MRGARVAVNFNPIGGHHSGTLEHNGERMRCDQCMGEVEAKRQQVLAGGWGSDEEEEGEAWDEEEALRRAAMDRTTFMGHCCGPSEGQRKHPDVLELVDVRLSLRVRGRRGVGSCRGGVAQNLWGFGVEYIASRYACSPLQQGAA